MRRIEVDGLRAIAVVSVLINHMNEKLLPNGHLGVDIFYVISGFVITQSLVTREHESFKDFILGFYKRRVKRLVPALFLCITLTCLCIFLLLPPQSSLAVSSLHTGIAALFGLSNLYLLAQEADYFSYSTELNAFTHTWSLGVEEQFYFLFPFLLWFSGLPAKTKTGERNFLLIISLSGASSLILYIFLSRMNPIMAFYLMPTRFWELAAGAVAYLILAKRQKPAERRRGILPHLSLFFLLVMTAVLFLPSEESRQAVITVTLVISTVFLLLTVRPASFAYWILTLKPMIFLGLISYSIYLWHWSVLTVSRWTVGMEAWSLWFQPVLILVLAALSHKFVETPLRKADWKVLKVAGFKIGEIGYALATALVLYALIMITETMLYKQGYLYAGRSAGLLKKGVHTLNEDQSYKTYSWVAKHCVLSSNGDVGKNIVPENCTFGDFHAAKRRFLVIGNSYSVSEIEMFKILLDKQLGSVTLISSWGASAVPETEAPRMWVKSNNYYWRTVVPSVLKQLRAGDVLIMVNNGETFSPKYPDSASQKALNNLREGLARISEEMRKRGVFVIYQSGNPFISESGCTPDTAVPQWWNLLSGTPCVYYTREESLERRRAYHSVLLELQHSHENFFVLDLFDVFCPLQICEFQTAEGVFLYRDRYSHPSVEACILAQPLLLRAVNEILY